MPDDLRTRIAALLRDATGDNYDNGHMADSSILWHEEGIPDAIDWLGVADAVIRELRQMGCPAPDAGWGDQ